MFVNLTLDDDKCTGAKLIQKKTFAMEKLPDRASGGCCCTACIRHAAACGGGRGAVRCALGGALEQALQGQALRASAVQVDHRAAVARVQHPAQSSQEACAAAPSPLARGSRAVVPAASQPGLAPLCPEIHFGCI